MNPTKRATRKSTRLYLRRTRSAARLRRAAAHSSRRFAVSPSPAFEAASAVRTCWSAASNSESTLSGETYAARASAKDRRAASTLFSNAETCASLCPEVF